MLFVMMTNSAGFYMSGAELEYILLGSTVLENQVALEHGGTHVESVNPTFGEPQVPGIGKPLK